MDKAPAGPAGDLGPVLQWLPPHSLTQESSLPLLPPGGPSHVPRVGPRPHHLSGCLPAVVEAIEREGPLLVIVLLHRHVTLDCLWGVGVRAQVVLAHVPGPQPCRVLRGPVPTPPGQAGRRVSPCMTWLLGHSHRSGTEVRESPTGYVGPQQPALARCMGTPLPSRACHPRSHGDPTSGHRRRRTKTYVHIQAPLAQPAGALAASRSLSIIHAEELSWPLAGLGLLRRQHHCGGQGGGPGVRPRGRWWVAPSP